MTDQKKKKQHRVNTVMPRVLLTEPKILEKKKTTNDESVQLKRWEAQSEAEELGEVLCNMTDIKDPNLQGRVINIYETLYTQSNHFQQKQFFFFASYISV